MSEEFRPDLLPVHIGSLPHSDAREACAAIQTWFPEVPGWPQLPKRGFLENLYAQFSEGFPGLVLEEDRIYVDRNEDLSDELERLYLAYLENDLDGYALGPSYAAGLVEWSRGEFSQCKAVKGQVVGPVSWGLTVVDQDRRPVLYDEVLADAIAKHLRLKAAWQERHLRQLHPRTILFVDEPYMASYGSAYVALGREQVTALMEEVLGGVEGLKGMHCCGNTDWSIVLSTSVDILSFDTYDYAESLSLYAQEVKEFLRRGGMITWGIVPREGNSLAKENTETLVDRLLWAMNLLVSKGIALDDLLASALISPCCGLGSLSVPEAERVLELTASVSQEMRRRYLRA
jgi:methionine synthase II (cobalamin-independent)